jgi:transmembrane sensor
VTPAPDTLELRAIRAQAAVWVTDLHGPERSPELEAGVRRWLAEDPRHPQAFELATDAWQRSGNLPAHLPEEPRPAVPLAASLRMRHSSRLTRVGFAGTAVLALVLATVFYLLKDPSLSTGYAEQKTVELSDGTEVTLNANSRVSVDYTDRLRKVTLTRGEALFNVTKHQTRPFVVIIGSRKVIALGTSFEVRREDTTEQGFTVTLIEGRVAIEPLAAPDLLPVEPADAILLNSGQRLRFAANSPDSVDSPAIDKVTAWRHGQLIFEDTSIREAAKEFNRYGKRRLAIDPSVSEELRVGGVFRIGDPDSFAHAMANAYHLRIIERTDELKLSSP